MTFFLTFFLLLFIMDYFFLPFPPSHSLSFPAPSHSFPSPFQGKMKSGVPEVQLLKVTLDVSSSSSKTTGELSGATEGS